MKLVHRLLPPLFLVAALAFFIANSWLLDRATVAATHSAIPPDTLSGIPEPRFFANPDSYAWLSHTRDMLLAGDWRIRHTHMDNAPAGRPMHWSHLLVWELAAHARLLQHLHPDIALSPALEIAGRCAMPIFALVFWIPIYVFLCRKLGFLPAAVWLAVSATIPFLNESASPLAPDHHLFQQSLIAATMLFLTFANWGRIATVPPLASPAPSTSFWLRLPPPPSESSARRWFAAAGACHAALLWIGATVWTVSHVVLCLAAMVSVAPSTPDSRPAPRLWLSFLSTALPLSIAFYLLEYAPHFPGMRLEINHPFHWLFLLGSILALSRISSPRKLLAPKTPRSFLVPALLVAPLPLALLFGPSSWHALHDPALRLLHGRYIEEFRPLFDRLRSQPFFPLMTFRFFLVPVLLAPWFLCRRPSDASRSSIAPLRPLSAAILGYALLYVWQIRWGHLMAALLPLLAVFAVAMFASPQAAPAPSVRGANRLAFLFLAVLFLDVTFSAARSVLFLRHWNTPAHCPANWLHEDSVKRAALRFAVALRGNDSAAFAGLPAQAPAFYWFAGIPALASFYWENADGWHDEAAFFADTSPNASAARAIAARRSLSHLLLPDGSDVIPRLYADLAARRLPSRNDLLVRLVASSRRSTPLPDWLTPDSDLSAALSITNYYHPAPETRICDALPVRAFRPVPQSP